jgi:3-deoxy-manno-octulosonate cytidylyltransferase (CMP-KDO synthetase)
MKAVVIIPARMASTRLPEKMLLKAAGKTLVQHTYERAARALRPARVLVATDDKRIKTIVEGFGGFAVMTNAAHSSGSARAAEAASTLDAEIIVNVQGDEPELDPAHIDRLIDVQTRFSPFASTLVCPFPDEARPEDPNCVKAVLGREIGDSAFDALYFTRALAPFPRDGASPKRDFHLHIGVYAFSKRSLAAFAAAPEGRLERIERLEQLRILEMGEKIVALRVPAAAPGIDTAADFEAFKARVEGRR